MGASIQIGGESFGVTYNLSEMLRATGVWPDGTRK